MSATKPFRYAALALQILEKLLGSRFSLSGIENLPPQPVMFVANHFTRFETFVIPYLIYKHTGRQVRCLADSSLYHGALGRFLESVGTISTKNSKRDQIILKDLISGDYDWMIYPEGSMLKSKEIKHDAGFTNYTPYRVGPVRTGSAVLALKSQLYRENMIDAFNRQESAALSEIEEKFSLKYDENFSNLTTSIVPLNITYYPLRPGDNAIQKLARRLVKKIPAQVAEELEIEGNLLLNGEVNIHFGAPINLAKEIKQVRFAVKQLPIITNETKDNLVLRYFKHRLTNDFMEKIYSDLQINLDHIFSAALFHMSAKEVRISDLKRVVYLSASMIQKLRKWRLHPSVLEENLVKIFCDEVHEEFDSALDLAIAQGAISRLSGDLIKINKSPLSKKLDFHEIRKENSLQVIANEFFLLESANDVVCKNAKIPADELRKKVFAQIYQRDLENFESDHQIYFDEKLSKEKSIGRPFFLSSEVKTVSRIKRIGILISHGYKSSPKEVEALAKFFAGFGFKVYAVRLKGHGTAPINLSEVSWQDWYDSLQRGYAALRNVCSQVLIVGFSTGGLLGLLSCARKNRSEKLAGIVVINAALKLRDIKARMVPGINLWNEMLEKLHIEKGRFEYVDDVPENPQTNYSRNYLKGVEQLEKLMKVCEENLPKISANALIIQANEDPVVSPVSGKIIQQKISSKQKQLVEMDFANHVIINCSRREEVFEEIRSFLSQLKIV